MREVQLALLAPVSQEVPATVKELLGRRKELQLICVFPGLLKITEKFPLNLQENTEILLYLIISYPSLPSSSCVSPQPLATSFPTFHHVSPSRTPSSWSRLLPILFISTVHANSSKPSLKGKVNNWHMAVSWVWVHLLTGDMILKAYEQHHSESSSLGRLRGSHFREWSGEWERDVRLASVRGCLC